MSEQNNPPAIDMGFYAPLPRIVRTGYKTITPIQKWLYACLKDLCGDHGTCYRSLRVLSAETGISTGLLSESIPVLNKAGLIHAEKKKRSTGGKEVWHITIVDIWQANGKAHPTKKCSQDEQTSENVQDMNKECSQDEQECSQILVRSNTNKAIPEEESAVSPTLEQPKEIAHTFSTAELIAMLAERGVTIPSESVSLDYTTSPTIEELSTQASDVSTDVHNSPSENGSQKSYSHKPATSAPSHVGMMPVMEVPMPPVMSEVVPAPPSVQVKPQAPFLRLVKKSDDPSDEAKAICALYEQVAGPGGFASWDWKAAEEMVKVHPTQADIQLIYDSLEGKKRNVEAIWLNWSTLATLKRNPPRKRPTGPVDSSYHPELETDETRAAREAKNKANMEKLDRRIAAKKQREQEEAAKRKAI